MGLIDVPLNGGKIVGEDVGFRLLNGQIFPGYQGLFIVSYLVG